MTMAVHRLGAYVRWAVVAIVVTMALTFVTVDTSEASLASIGTSIIRWMSRADIVGHHIEAVVDVDNRIARFTDDATIRSRGGKTLLAILGDDFVIESVTEVETGRALTFKPHINLRGLPFTIFKVDLPPMTSGEEIQVRFEWIVSDETIRFFNPFPRPGYFYVGHTSLWHPYTPDEGFFTADIEVAAARHMTVIADGRRTSVFEEGRWKSVRFQVDTPVNGIGIAVGPFEQLEPLTVGGSTIRGFYPPGWDKDAPDGVASVRTYVAEAYRYLSDHIAPLGVDDWYVVQFPFVDPASYPSLYGIVYGGDLGLVGGYDKPSLANIMSHETVHRWFGSAVGIRVVGSAWLSEGLGEYLGYLAMEKTVTPSQFRRVFRERTVEPYEDLIGRRESKPLGKIEFLDEEWRQLQQKGALLFRDMHAYIGDEHFFPFIRHFFEVHRGEVVSGTDFLRFVRDYFRSNVLRGPRGRLQPRHIEQLIHQWLRSDPDLKDDIDQ